MSNGGGFGRRGVRNEDARRPPSVAPKAPSKQASWRLVLGLTVGLIGFAGGSWAGREAVQQLFSFRASAELDRQVSDMQRLARAKYPNLDPVDAAARYARETAPDLVNASKSDRERAMKAAATFFGFYHINTRSRVEHCAQLGVDLAPFKRAIERLHRREYSRALAIAAASGMTEERLWGMVRSQLASLVKADMDAVARRTLSTPAGACRLMVDRADEFADKLDFATLQPQIQRILMGS